MVAAMFLVSAIPAKAGNLRFEVQAVKKKLGSEKSDSSSTQTRQEEWGYEVTVTNRSFQDVSGLKAEYIVFMKDAKPGSTERPTLVRTKASQDLGALQNGRCFTFQTKPMELTKTQLKGGWVWGSGADPRSTDRLSGIWVRIYKDGQVVADSSIPTSLSSQEPWEK